MYYPMILQRKKITNFVINIIFNAKTIYVYIFFLILSEKFKKANLLSFKKEKDKK